MPGMAAKTMSKIAPRAIAADPGSRLPVLARLRNVGAAALLVAATLGAYGSAIRGGFIWDDAAHVQENRNLQDLGGLWRTWTDPSSLPQYYPLVHTTFWIEHHLWRLDPRGYHMVNVLLHAASVIVLWRLLRRLGLPGAYVAAALFALHPVNVESVAWITERKNVLSGLFYLLAMSAYLRFCPPEEPPADWQRPWRNYWLAAGLFACALLSKTVTASLPAAIAVILWWKRPRLRSRDLLPLAPLLALGVVMGLMTAHLEQTHVGAVGEDWALSPTERLLVAGRALCFYAGKLFWPDDLMFIYPRWKIDPGQWQQWLFPIAAMAALAALWALRRPIGKGPLAAGMLFAGTLAPALGFLSFYPMRYSYVADHFQYLAGIALLTLGAATAAELATRARLPAWVRVAAGVAVCTILATLTWRQGTIYRDLFSLYADTLAKNPACWMAHNNLGRELENRGDRDGALEHYNAAIALKSDYGEAYYNRGNNYLLRKQFDRAIPEYNQAIEHTLQENTPAWIVMAYVNRGMTCALLGRFDDAMADCNRAIELDADSPAAYCNRAAIRYRWKQYDLAWQDVRQCREHSGIPPPALIRNLVRDSGRGE